MVTNKETANQLFEKHRSRNRWKPNYLNLATSVVITACVAGIVVGSGVDLPSYAWACIGTLIGLVNPVGRK